MQIAYRYVDHIRCTDQLSHLSTSCSVRNLTDTPTTNTRRTTPITVEKPFDPNPSRPKPRRPQRAVPGHGRRSTRRRKGKQTPHPGERSGAGHRRRTLINEPSRHTGPTQDKFWHKQHRGSRTDSPPQVRQDPHGACPQSHGTGHWTRTRRSHRRTNVGLACALTYECGLEGHGTRVELVTALLDRSKRAKLY